MRRRLLSCGNFARSRCNEPHRRHRWQKRQREARAERAISGGAGEAVGITFQQIQKYERGQNRISASRLVELAKAVGVPVTELFAGVEEEASQIETRNLAEMRREHKVVEQYALLPDDVQKALGVLVKAMTIALGQKFQQEGL